MKDYYKVLGVERNATEAEIKKSFRKLALECHPDRNPDDKACEERFKEINEAYSCLCDPKKRANYDRFGTAEGVGAGGFGAGGFGASGFGDIFEDLFGDFFGSTYARRGSRARRGSDLRYDLDITMEEAAFGTERTIEILRWEDCTECGGTGSKSRKTTVCPDCMGSGQVRFQQGFFTVSKTCGKCSGQGNIVTDPCRACDGQGKRRNPKKISVKVPPGVDSGSRLKMSGEGAPGESGGPPGDLYIVIDVRPHEFFVRDGMDIFCQVSVLFTEAALGAEIDVPTLDGTEKLKVHAGTQPGERLRLKGKGIARLGARTRGDQVVVVNVEVPKKINKRQREILEEFQRLSSENHGEGIKDRIKNMFAGKA